MNPFFRSLVKMKLFESLHWTNHTTSIVTDVKIVAFNWTQKIQNVAVTHSMITFCVVHAMHLELIASLLFELSMCPWELYCPVCHSICAFTHSPLYNIPSLATFYLTTFLLSSSLVHEHSFKKSLLSLMCHESFQYNFNQKTILLLYLHFYSFPLHLKLPPVHLTLKVQSCSIFRCFNVIKFSSLPLREKLSQLSTKHWANIVPGRKR